MKNSIILLLTLALSLATLSKPDKDDIAAIVNGKPISQGELFKTYNQNLLLVTDKIVTRKKVITDLINRELGIQKAKKAKLQDDPVVKEKIEDIMFHAQMSKDLEPELKKITVSDKEAKEYYRKFPEYRTSHILLRIKVKPEEDEWKEAQKQSQRIYNTLMKNPKEFTKLANKFSQSNTAPNGGDLGFQPAVRLAPEYFQAIKGKKPGFITPPVRTQFGYHVIKVVDVRKEKDINMSLYKKILYDKKRDEVIANYFKSMRSKANIVIKDKSLQ